MDFDSLVEAKMFETDVQPTTQGFVNIDEKDMCSIDEETVRTLELIKNSADLSNKRHSLFGYLNSNTSTTTGSRLLQEAILKPLCHLETIEHRLECIEYLVNRVDTLGKISSAIRHYGLNVDLDHVVPVLQNLSKTKSSTLSMAEKRLDALTTLETLVNRVQDLTLALEEADQPMLNAFRTALQDPTYQEILTEISNVIEIDKKTPRGKRAKMFRIKTGVESLFDIARSTYNAAINDLEQYVRELQREDGIPWKLGYGETRGYYLTLYPDQMPKNTTLSPRYIQCTRSRTLITCTTRDLMQSNVRASVSYENSMKLANEVLTNTITSIINNTGAMNKLISVVGMLDMITSFAKLVNMSHGNLVRPVFTPSETIIVKGRHPVLESVLNLNQLTIVPNDTVFSTGHKNFMLVTGPNMGGKSIFLKQVAIIQIMAQIGCYVPAESAHIKLMDRIVARSGSQEDSQSSCSSFMWEMKGIASAIQRDSESSIRSVLFVIDEIGRGTTIDDGASYSFAIAEELALRRNCFTVFATHFDQVFYLTSLYGNVLAYHFEYHEEEDGRLKISHNLVPGYAERNHYGIKLAQAIGLPEEIIAIAMRGINQGTV